MYRHNHTLTLTQYFHCGWVLEYYSPNGSFHPWDTTTCLCSFCHTPSPCLFVFFQPSYIFTRPPSSLLISPSLSLPPSLRIRVIIWAVCSPPAPMYPLFPLLSPPPVKTCPPPPTFLPASLSLIYFSISPPLKGLWGPSTTPELLCVSLPQWGLTKQRKRARAHRHTQVKYTPPTSWRCTGLCHILFLFTGVAVHTCRQRNAELSVCTHMDEDRKLCHQTAQLLQILKG